MPYKDLEKRRAYDRERKRKKRSKQKITKKKALEQHLRENPFDFISGMPKYKPEPFMSWSEFKQKNHDATFKDYLTAKTEYYENERYKPLTERTELNEDEKAYSEALKRLRRRRDLIGFKDSSK